MTTVAIRVVAVSLKPRTMVGMRFRCSRAAAVKCDIGSPATIKAASASPRAERVRGGVFPGAESRIAAGEVDRERIAGLPRQDVVGPGDVAGPSHRHADESSMSVHVADQGKKRVGTLVCIESRDLARAERRSRHTWPASSDPSIPAMSTSETPVSASIGAASRSTPLARARKAQSASNVLAWLDRDELVGHSGGCGFLNVDHDTKAVLAASRHKQARRCQAVPAQVARMALSRVAAPEDDQIAPVPDFTKRARDLAHLLECENGRAVRDALSPSRRSRRSNRRSTPPRVGPPRLSRRGRG